MPASPHGSTVEGGRPRVLVVEDDPDMNRFVRDTLGADYHVVSAANGAEGLEVARRVRPDLIVSDVMMPVMGGDDLLAAIRADPALAGTPVVMLTARADEALRLKLLQAGANDYVAKPFSVAELQARVANLLRLKRSETQARARETELRASERRALVLAAFAEALPAVGRDPEAVLDFVARQLTQYPGDSCCVLALGEDAETLVPVVWHHRDEAALATARELLAKRPYTINSGPAGEAFRRGEPVLVETVDPAVMRAQVPVEYRQWLDEHPIASIAYVPIRVNAESVGLMVVQRHEPAPPLCQDDFAFLQEVSRRAALAYENARLYREVEQGQRRFASAFHDAPIGMAMCSLDESCRGRFLDVNPAYCALVGMARERLLTMKVGDLTHPQNTGIDSGWLAAAARGEGDDFFVEKQLRHADGRPIWVRVSISVVRNSSGKPLHTVNHVEDITARKEAEAHLTSRAMHDLVTGLPNRALLMDRLEHALTELVRSQGAVVAVLFVDLDRFKQINDTFGHAVGDQFLVEMARRISGTVRPPDTVARIGGDEFVVVCNNVTSEADAEHIAGRVIAAVSRPHVINGQELVASASVGIALTHDAYCDAHELLRQADTAMYRAKEGGRSRYETYTDALRVDALARYQLETDLRHAVENDLLQLRYQPIIDLRTGSTTEVEALVRYEHPTRGLLRPNEFLDLAEESGLIVGLGYWVLAEACRQQVRLRSEFPGPRGEVRMAVNLSARQLQDSKLAAVMEDVFAQTGADPTRLRLEVTETVYMGAVHSVLSAIEHLTRLGISFAIDDFGTGYSSLVYLKRFPVDVIKIDQSFVAGLGKNKDDAAIVTATIGLAHSLGLAAIAEGVETSAQAEHLLALGCDYAQGYLYAEPLEADAILEYLRQGPGGLLG